MLKVVKLRLLVNWLRDSKTKVVKTGFSCTDEKSLTRLFNSSLI